MTRRIYPRPPIVEALAELQFEQHKLDEGARKEIASRLAASYEGRRWRREDLIIQATATPTSIGTSATRVDGPEYFINADQTRIIGLGPQSLSVHVLAPYPGWEAFLDAIHEAVDALPADAAVSGFSRLTLRYIDRWSIDRGMSALQEFVTIAPTWGIDNVVPRRLHVFNEFAGGHENESAALVLVAVPLQEGGTSILLDMTLSAVPVNGEAAGKEMWADTLKRLHTRQRDIFEASITDASRELFK